MFCNYSQSNKAVSHKVNEPRHNVVWNLWSWEQLIFNFHDNQSYVIPTASSAFNYRIKEPENDTEHALEWTKRHREFHFAWKNHRLQLFKMESNLGQFAKQDDTENKLSGFEDDDDIASIIKNIKVNSSGNRFKLSGTFSDQFWVLIFKNLRYNFYNFKL